jgi:hypothetical protein
MSDSTTTTIERTNPSRIVRIGLVGAAAAAILAVGILAAGATASPGATLAAGAGGTGSTESVNLAPGAPRDGGPGGRFGEMRGFHGITITAISGSKISLATGDGWTRTITVDSGTTYAKGSDTIALKDLAVGDEIRFQQTREDNGTFTIDAIAVIPPHAGGTVTAISGSTITVERRDGSTATIKVTSGTTYSIAGTAGSLADVKVGMRLMAEGTKNSDGSLTATEVRAADPDSMPGPGGRGEFRGPGGHGPWGDDTTPDGSAG